MIKIFDASAASFSNNGLGVLTPSRCLVSWENNGNYTLQMDHPCDPDGKHLLIENQRILSVPTPIGDDLFRIVSVDKTMPGKVSVYARHITYDLLGTILQNININNQQASVALTAILSGTGFTGTSDLTSNHIANWNLVNPIQAIMGDTHSILTLWGGEVDRYQKNIDVNQRVGSNRSVTIRYAKNLTGLTAKTDYSEIITRIMPTGQKADGTILTIPGLYVDSPLIGTYYQIFAKNVHFNDIKAGTDDYPTEADAVTALTAAANKMITDGCDKPLITINVELVDLSQTEEYKNFAVVETILPGDTLRVYYEPFNINLLLRATSYTYDAILERYDKIQLGAARRTIVNTINAQITKIPAIETQVSLAASAADAATKALLSPGNSYVRFSPSLENPTEIYIMDSPAPGTATNVIRFNSAGWGISKTGINGPYTIAATGAGIVADAITTGILNADLIRAGSLTSVNGTTFNLNLDTGTMSIDGSSGGGVSMYNADITAEAQKVFVKTDYSQTDVDRIQSILLGTVTATAQDYARLDFNADGFISLLDGLICTKLIQGYYGDSLTIKYRVDIAADPDALIVVGKDVGGEVDAGFVAHSTGATIDQAYINTLRLKVGTTGDKNKDYLPVAAPSAVIGTHLQSFSTLEQLELVTGSETIAKIHNALPQESILVLRVLNTNAAIYPTSYGVFTAYKGAGTYMAMTYISAGSTQGSAGEMWVASAFSSSVWSTWHKL